MSAALGPCAMGAFSTPSTRSSGVRLIGDRSPLCTDIAQIIELMGAFPRHIALSGKFSSEIFTRKGEKLRPSLFASTRAQYIVG